MIPGRKNWSCASLGSVNRDAYHLIGKALAPTFAKNFFMVHELINNENTFLVDVRTPGEVAEQSVPGAVNIPLQSIPDELDRFKEAEGDIVVFCRSGARSENAKQWLTQNGVANVHNAGGIADVLMMKM